jgi:riboflavin kinase/FMN adenylyltransferase
LNILKFIRYPQFCDLNKPSAVTIGNFDGIHLGHQYLIRQIVKRAKKDGLQSIVVTMSPLASQYFAGKDNVKIITPFKQKFKLFKDLKANVGCFLNFNDKLAHLEAEEFIQDVLIDGLNAQYILIGDDFRFGKKRKGDFQLLKSYCEDKNIVVDNISSVKVVGQRVSSSLVREKLKQSDFVSVKEFLGRDYSIIGKVSKGQQLGRELGYPTINIKLTNQSPPVEGIFCVSVKFDNGSLHYGAASLGYRPTVNGTGKILEVHLLDFDKQVYGEIVEVLFHHKLRNEVKFGSLEELKQNIDEDVRQTRLFFQKQISKF